MKNLAKRNLICFAVLAVILIALCFVNIGVPATTSRFVGFVPAITKDIDISGGVEAVFSPDKEGVDITSDDMESAKLTIENRLVNENITDYEVFVDNNNLQIDGTCDEVMPNGDLGQKFRDFGFDTYEIDGNDMEQMVAALTLARVVKNGKPKCIYGHTVKGKGVSYMENVCSWHGVAPNEAEWKQAMDELDQQYVK